MKIWIGTQDRWDGDDQYDAVVMPRTGGGFSSWVKGRSEGMMEGIHEDIGVLVTWGEKEKRAK